MTSTRAHLPDATALPHDSRLRPLLGIDTLLTAGNGAIYLLWARTLADWFGTPSGLLRWLGLVLVIVGLAILVVLTRRPIPRPPVLTVATINAAWTVASAGYAVFGSLTAAGRVWVVLQGVVVAGFAWLQYRWSRPTLGI